MVFQHQLCNACIVLRLNEAMQRRLALCSHHASSGALLLLREQSRGQGRGQTGVSRGSGHGPAGARGQSDEGQVGGEGGGVVQSRGGQAVHGIPDQQHHEAAALKECLAKQQYVLLCQEEFMLELHQEYSAQSGAKAAGIHVWSWP